MKRIPIRNAKLFIKLGSGEWRELQGVQLPDAIYSMEPQDTPAEVPVKIPALRNFTCELAPYDVRPFGPLEVPPMDVDPMRN